MVSCISSEDVWTVFSESVMMDMWVCCVRALKRLLVYLEGVSLLRSICALMMVFLDLVEANRAL